VALYAPPASFKSFIALDIAECIATGRAFLGNQITRRGAVLYIAGEGHGGIGSRIKALKTHHKTPVGAPVYFLRRQVNLRSSKTDLQDLVAAIDDLKAIHDINFELIIIDTLARSFGGGNENASEDMGAFITAAGAIQGRYECGLLVVHHAGKDATKGLRGHSSLLGAVDTELEIIRIEGAKPPKGILHVSKQKDGVDGQRIGFKMVEVNSSSLNVADTSSLAVEHDEKMDTTVKEKVKQNPPDATGNGKNQRLAMECLHEVVAEKGFMRESIKCVGIGYWEERFRQKKGNNIAKKSVDKAWKEVQEDLVDYKKVVINRDICWIVYEDKNASEYEKEEEYSDA